MNYLTTLDTQQNDEVKLRNLIETFADAFQYRLQHAYQFEESYGQYEKTARIKYNNVEFEVHEYFTNDVTTGEGIHRLSIVAPMNINNDTLFITQRNQIFVMWKCGHTMSEALDERKKGCYALAHKFVEEVLPKVDFEIEKIVYKRNIDKILSVLDGPSYEFNDFQNG